MKQFAKTLLALALALVVVMMSMTVTVLAEETLNYAESGLYLEVGTNAHPVDSAYEYTVYVFSPTETGKYAFSSADSLIGIVSYTDMWVQNTPSADNVNASSFVWECTAVGQGIMIAAKSDTDTATIVVEREGLVVEEEVPWTYYENVVTPEAFVLEGNFDDMMYVDTADGVADKAVPCEDGHYHLNDASGPILYACLSDPMMSLEDAHSYGQLKEVLVDDEGNVTSKTDFNDAFAEYLACADTTGLYPLTVDLIEMFTRVGAYQNWYDENGFVGGDPEDAWMFACYYNEGESFDTTTTTTTDAATTTTTTITATAATTTTVAAVTTTTTAASATTTTTTAASGGSPNTDDVSDAFGFMLAAMLAAGAIGMAMVSKKVKA